MILDVFNRMKRAGAIALVIVGAVVLAIVLL